MELEKKLKGTKSEKNVMEAFSGESCARNKYSYYAQQARDAGNDKIGCLFDAMAKNEWEHARVWFNLLYGTGSIEENLVAAAKAENEEWKTTYPSYARQAREEGFEILAMLFEKIAAIENDHEKRFQEALAELRSGHEDAASLCSIDTAAPAKNEAEHAAGGFRCMFCGNVEAVQLEECPICGAAGGYEAI